MRINNIQVKVIREEVILFGRTWTEIDFYPILQSHYSDGSIDCEDWEVISNDNMTLYMNNMDGYMVLIEKEKSHWEENKGFVIDKKGHIYITYF